MKADLITTNYGTIIAITGNTGKGRRWLRHNVEDARNGCDTVNAEHRYGIDIIIGAVNAGLRCQDSETGHIAHAI